MLALYGAWQLVILKVIIFSWGRSSANCKVWLPQATIAVIERNFSESKKQLINVSVYYIVYHMYKSYSVNYFSFCYENSG